MHRLMLRNAAHMQQMRDRPGIQALPKEHDVAGSWQHELIPLKCIPLQLFDRNLSGQVARPDLKAPAPQLGVGFGQNAQTSGSQRGPHAVLRAALEARLGLQSLGPRQT